MKKILLINGAKAFGESQGKLNATLHEEAKKTLQSLGYITLETIIDKGYKGEEEVQKLLDSCAFILQMPSWWMGEPWIVKKWLDELGQFGYNKLFKSDGRSRENPSKNYGKGGLSMGKKFMFSVTWNAPLEAFNDKNEFFGGVGVEAVYLHLSKAFEFMGFEGLPIFVCNDVVKNPKIETYVQNYKEHLKKYFG